MQFPLLQKLLPHEMSQYVIETLDVRLHHAEGGVSGGNGGAADIGDSLVRLSDHRPLVVQRGNQS